MDRPRDLDPFFPSGESRPSPPRAGAGDLIDRLPGLYREDSGDFLALARAVAEAAGGIAEEVRSREDPEEPVAAERPEPELPGTRRGLLRCLSEGGPPPEVWNGVTVKPSGNPGELEVVSCDRPSAVIAWPQGTDPRRADPASIPAGILPAGTAVRAVLLRGPAPRPEVRGDRFQGEVLR